jgi:hypothetical protein
MNTIIRKGGLTVFALSILLITSSCKEEKMEAVYKDSYTISLGEDIFQIPAEYLLDVDNRMDGAQRYVKIIGKIPDLVPFENALSYTRLPNRTNEGVSFSLNYGDGKKLPPDSLLHNWSEQGHYTVPETWDQEGLIHLGIFKLAGKKKENIYAYVRDGSPIAQLRCSTYPDTPNPSCRVYQSYHGNMMSIHVVFDIENLDWYATEGLDKILRKVESWRVKPEQE